MPSEPIGSKLRVCLDEFAADPRVSAQAAQNLEAAITRSPALMQQMNRAADNEELKHFQLKSNDHAGGSFDSKNQTMALGLDDLTGDYDPDNLTFVLGHEVQHGVKAPGEALTPMDQARAAFTTAASALAASDTPVHDYTPALTAVMQAHRVNEATAHIQGWNAMVSAIRETDSSPSLEDIYNASPRAADFIEQSGRDDRPTYRLRRGLTLEADQSISATNPANVTAMGEYYFDKSASDARLGHQGGSDYSNRYGANYAGELSRLELDRGGTARVEIDMDALGFRERTLERNGIDLGSHSGERLPYYDIGGRRPELSHFDHSIESHEHVRNNRVSATAPAETPAPAPTPTPATTPAATSTPSPEATQTHAPAQTPAPASDLRSASHPDHALYQGIHDKLNVELQRQSLPLSQGDSERLAAALTVQARLAGIDRADHVVMGVQTPGAGPERSAFVVQGGLDDPAHRRAGTPIQAALNTPVEESTRQLDAQIRPAPTPNQVPEQQRALAH